jgi:DNA-binding transcriptional ArsR family regulator
MTPHSANRSLDTTLFALADPTRRAILRRLAKSEARVTDVAAPFRISLNSVSKHIRILERAKLVERRRAGREHLLRFRPTSLNGVQEWISQQQSFWRASLEGLDAMLKQTSQEEKQE